MGSFEIYFCGILFKCLK